jgi:hypothetical protein
MRKLKVNAVTTRHRYSSGLLSSSFSSCTTLKKRKVDYRYVTVLVQDDLDTTVYVKIPRDFAKPREVLKLMDIISIWLESTSKISSPKSCEAFSCARTTAIYDVVTYMRRTNLAVRLAGLMNQTMSIQLLPYPSVMESRPTISSNHF